MTLNSLLIAVGVAYAWYLLLVPYLPVILAIIVAVLIGAYLAFGTAWIDGRRRL